MIRFAILTGYLISVAVLFACGDTEKSKIPVIQPKKEATWVRTEKVQTTKEAVFSGAKNILAEISINDSLVEKITTKKTGSVLTTNKASCFDRLKSLDLRRTLVQKSGGMWGAFERNMASKPFSVHGMQLDSNVNKMIFSLRYLCETSEGVPLNKIAIEFKKLIEEHGREGTKKILISRGEHPKDIEKFLNYEEFARKISSRKIDFKAISSRLDQAENLIGFYEEFSGRSTKGQSIDEFLSSSVTLLKVINEFMHTDKMMVMALNEDGVVPYYHVDQDM